MKKFGMTLAEELKQKEIQRELDRKKPIGWLKDQQKQSKNDNDFIDEDSFFNIDVE